MKENFTEMVVNQCRGQLIGFIRNQIRLLYVAVYGSWNESEDPESHCLTLSDLPGNREFTYPVTVDDTEGNYYDEPRTLAEVVVEDYGEETEIWLRDTEEDEVKLKFLSTDELKALGDFLATKYQSIIKGA